MFTFFKSKHNQFVTILSTFFSDFREFFYVKRVQFNKNSSKLIVKPASQQSIRWLLKVYMENFKGAAIILMPIAPQHNLITLTVPNYEAPGRLGTRVFVINNPPQKTCRTNWLFWEIKVEKSGGLAFEFELTHVSIY